MKKCSKCNIEKELSEFYKSKVNKDGYCGRCISCTKEQVSFYRENNLDKVKERVNKYREKNIEDAVLYNKIWREENKEYKKKKDKEYQEKNKEVLKTKKREYREKNKEVLKEKREVYFKVIGNRERKRKSDREYQKANRAKRNLRHSERMKIDIIYCLSHIIRGSILKCFKGMGKAKSSKTYEILGCSFEDLKTYLESKFEPWMNWDNRGKYNGELDFGWDLDHEIPLSSAMSEQELIKLNHYKNLSPLCSKVNRDIKKNKINI